MRPRRGMVFEHPTQKVRCVVTAVRPRLGKVYWRLEHSPEAQGAYTMSYETFDTVKVLRQPERCLTCGGTQGVWSDDPVDPQWTCQGCGDEWPKATFLAAGEE